MTPDVVANTIKQILVSYQKVASDTLEAIFDLLWELLSPYWPYFLLVFFILVVIATIKLSRGRWGAMGSLIYNTIYFGVLAIIIAIAGVKILLNPIFDLFCAILYPVAFWLSGLALKRLGVRL